GNNLPFSALFLAIVFIALRGGLGPALFTVIAGYIAVDYLFVPPRHSMALSGFSGWAHAFIYFLVGFVTVWLAHVQRVAQNRARASEQLALRRLSELETLYEQAPIGLCFTDTNHRYVRINEELAALGG